MNRVGSETHPDGVRSTAVNAPMPIAEVHAEIDAIIRKLQAAKSRRGGTLRCELGQAGDRLHALSWPALDAVDTQ